MIQSLRGALGRGAAVLRRSALGVQCRTGEGPSAALTRRRGSLASFEERRLPKRNDRPNVGRLHRLAEHARVVPPGGAPTPLSRRPTALPPEQRFSVLTVGLHGLFAVMTVVLAVLAALELSRRE